MPDEVWKLEDGCWRVEGEDFRGNPTAWFSLRLVRAVSAMRFLLTHMATDRR
jgi:hypothetical protein